MKNHIKEPYSLSVVMPAFNEEAVIAKVVADYCSILDRFERPEFLIVDDCSTDSTLSVLKSLVVKYPYLRIIASETNRGHGPSLLRAYRESTGDNVFHCDSDQQFVSDDFWLLWDKRQKDNCDVVIGYRRNRQDSVARKVLTRLLRMFLMLLFRVHLTDSNSPFKLHTRAALDCILPLLPDHCLVPSILMAIAAHRLKLAVGWINVRHLPRKHGASFLRSWKIFRLCLPAVGEVMTFRRTLAREKV